jgi:hypothetical protein
MLVSYWRKETPRQTFCVRCSAGSVRVFLDWLTQDGWEWIAIAERQTHENAS